MTSMRRMVVRWLPVLILAGAGAVAWHLIRTRPRAQPRPQPELSATVELLSVAPTSLPVRIRALGVITAAREVVMMPEVAGRIVERHRNLEPGGRVRAGEELVRIDPRDYEAAVAQAVAAVEKAKFDLAVEEGRRTVAEAEWRRLGAEVPSSEAGRALALREPHLRAARAALAAAESSLDRARLNLERTSIRAPFDAVVLEKTADVGQVVGPQSRLARLADVAVAWAQLSLPVADLEWLVHPDSDGEGGSLATVWLEQGGGRRASRQGRVVRVLADVEPAGRLARVLVAVPAALVGGDGAPPFPLGVSVEAEIIGRVATNVVVLPREALREGDQVWLASAQDRLELRAVKVARRLPETVLIADGLREGDRVVLGRIALAIPGMRLRTAPAAQ
ncbi:MAG: efflux RND transporter periplasmic adaptor subunit [Kiritimatiellae bacterium]|nr:efflux RND transporter periplasmic adaptor subunit [Kiritimatiellia bacterium]